MFLIQAVANNGFPFEIKRVESNPYTAMTEEDLNEFIKYLLFEKKSDQAAKNLLNDFDATVEKLKVVAGSLKLCDNPRL